MTRFGCCALVLATIGLLLAAACGVDFNGTPRGDEQADWESFDYVFSGDSPDPEGDAMIVMLDVNDDGAVTGEVQSIFWSTFSGVLVGQDLGLEMTFKDNRCEDPAHAEFAGVLTGERFAGHFWVWACEWSEFDYVGDLVGGRRAP